MLTTDSKGQISAGSLERRGTEKRLCYRYCQEEEPGLKAGLLHQFSQFGSITAQQNCGPRGTLGCWGSAVPRACRAGVLVLCCNDLGVGGAPDRPGQIIAQCHESINAEGQGHPL